jgi:hypothetical protein
MLESHILGTDGKPVVYNGRPLMKHPMIDKNGKPVMGPDQIPVFYAAGILMVNP